MSVIFFAVLSAIFGFLLLIFDLVFVRDPKKRGIEVITDPRTGKKRKRIFEGAFDQGIHDDIYCFGQALVSRVVFFESLVPLDKSGLIEGLVSVAKVHPLLRMKCEWECSKGKTYRYLTEMDNVAAINELLYSEINTERDNWKGVLEDELLRGFDLSRGPLWRVTRFKEVFDSTSNTYNNTILFTFHHSICDGVSIINFFDKLLEVMDKLFYGDLLDKNLKPLPLLEPLPVLIEHHTELPWTQILRLKLEHYIHRLQALLKLSPKNLFLERFPPPVRSDSMVKSKTVLKPSSLTVEDTAVFVNNCKVHNCTVGGALAATLAIAVRNLLNSNDSSNEITLGLPVNIRSGCKPVVSNQDFGFYIGILFIPFSIPSEISSLDDYFWELARKMTADIKEKISKDEQYSLHRQGKYNSSSFVDFWESAKKDVHDAGRYPVFELNNVGNYDLDKQRVYKITEIYSAVSVDILGPVMSVIAITVSGKLCWNVTHSTRAVSEEVAENYSEEILKLIKDIGCSQKGFS